MATDFKGPGVFLGLCPFCGKENGEIVLDGRMKKNRENDPKFAMTTDACDECKDAIKNKGYIGIMLVDPDYVNVKNGVLKPKDAKRIEGGALVKRTVLEAIFRKEMQSNIVFMEIDLFKHIFKSGKDGNISINPDIIKSNQ